MAMPEVETHFDPIEISPFSRAAVRIEILRKDAGAEIARSSASGFLWQSGSSLFLFTNWHAISGVNPETGKHLGDFIPNCLRVHHFAERKTTGNEPSGFFLVNGSFEINLDIADPTEGWMCHPKGKCIDLIARKITLPLPDDLKPICLNSNNLWGVFDGEVGEDVFVVGYPEGEHFERRLPIWKRGTIATDVSLNQRDLPQYLIDTLGNRGLSGAFVLHAPILSLLGDETGRTKRKFSFAGVYAGRMGEIGIKSQLGRIIKPSALDELLEAAA